MCVAKTENTVWTAVLTEIARRPVIADVAAKIEQTASEGRGSQKTGNVGLALLNRVSEFGVFAREIGNDGTHTEPAM